MGIRGRTRKEAAVRAPLACPALSRSAQPRLETGRPSSLQQKLPALPLGMAVQDPLRKARPRMRSGFGYRRNVRKVPEEAGLFMHSPSAAAWEEEEVRPSPSLLCTAAPGLAAGQGREGREDGSVGRQGRLAEVPDGRQGLPLPPGPQSAPFQGGGFRKQPHMGLSMRGMWLERLREQETAGLLLPWKGYS